MVSMDKIQSLEASAHHTQTTQQQEQLKVREQRNQLLQQLVDIRQKEEMTRKELEEAKKNFETKETHIKELEDKIIQLQKQNNQVGWKEILS